MTIRRLRPTSSLEAYKGLTAFAGDLHNHCGISYGHGSIEDAYRNAQLQLDFASVTGHANWHDMPADPAHVAKYHTEGFKRLENSWEHVQDVTEQAHIEGEFVSFLSFEWHSMTYGDHCVYYKSARGPLAPAQANSLEELRTNLRNLNTNGFQSMVLPHHIGYSAGRRGINWETFTEELSPVIELVSMHGSGEADLSPRPYLHTMGPRDLGSVATTGLARGNKFGFIGSTDHHSAHPGSHGYGVAMVWAEELSRDAIWDAIQARRTYAITGNSIMLAVSLNGFQMGQTAAPAVSRKLEIEVNGGSRLEAVEIIKNGSVIASNAPAKNTNSGELFEGTLSAGFGWGEVGVNVDWDAEIELIGGEVETFEPRLRGYDTLADQAGETEKYSFSEIKQLADNRWSLKTRTYGNPTTTTDASQQFALHVKAPLDAVLQVKANGKTLRRTIREQLEGPKVEYVGGFISGAFVIQSAVSKSDKYLHWQFEDKADKSSSDLYYVRVKQANDQFAWSSPIWVEGADA
jgi:hypothetical protein